MQTDPRHRLRPRLLLRLGFIYYNLWTMAYLAAAAALD